MGTAVLAVFVHRFRRLYLGVAIAMLVLIVLGQVGIPQYAYGFLLPPVFLGLFATLAAFSNPESDLASESSGYPAFLLRQPVGSFALAIWPIVGGVVWAVGSWLVLAIGGLRPAGFDVPIWWPATLVAALAVSLQGILWMPLRYGIVRLILGVTCPIALLAAGLWMYSEGVKAEQILIVYGVVMLCSAVAAIIGVRSARVRGAFHSQPRDREFKDRAQKRPPFRSPFLAHVWLEWRKQGRILPMITGFVMVFLSIPLFVDHPLYELNIYGQVRVNPWVFSWVRVLVIVPILISTILGMGAARSYLRNQDGAYHLFFATRPLSGAQLVRAKFTSIGLGVVLAWALTLGTIFAWLQTPITTGVYEAPRHGTLWGYLLDNAPGEFWIQVASVVILCVFLTYRNQIIGAFADFTIGKSVRGLYAASVAISGGIAFTLFKIGGEILRNQANYLTVLAGVTIVLLTKLVVSGFIASRLTSIQPEVGPRLRAGFGVWVVCAVVAGSLAWWWVPAFLPHADHLLFKGLIPIVIAVLTVPLARPMAARLAVELGRHRA